MNVKSPNKFKHPMARLEEAALGLGTSLSSFLFVAEFWTTYSKRHRDTAQSTIDNHTI